MQATPLEIVSNRETRKSRVSANLVRLVPSLRPPTVRHAVRARRPTRRARSVSTRDRKQLAPRLDRVAPKNSAAATYPVTSSREKERSVRNQPQPPRHPQSPKRHHARLVSTAAVVRAVSAARSTLSHKQADAVVTNLSPTKIRK